MASFVLRLIVCAGSASALHLPPLRSSSYSPPLSSTSKSSSNRRTAPAVCLATPRQQEPFALAVDLGDGCGTVEHTLQPFFTKSSLVTVRVPLPFDLEAEPIQGCFKVVQDGYGLRVGDVLRACSTLQMRYDSDKEEMRVGPGLPGKADAQPAASSKMPEWLSSFQSNFNPWTAFAPQRPAKCLFIADGQPHSRVADALVANEMGKVREMVLVLERPADK